MGNKSNKKSTFCFLVYSSEKKLLLFLLLKTKPHNLNSHLNPQVMKVNFVVKKKNEIKEKIINIPPLLTECETKVLSEWMKYEIIA